MLIDEKDSRQEMARLTRLEEKELALSKKKPQGNETFDERPPRKRV